LNAAATINSNSLYTGKVFRNILTSTIKRNGASFTATCRLLPGSLHNHKPTTVIIDSLGAGLNANDQLDIALSIVNGPTVELWTNARFVTLDSSFNNLDLYTFEHLTYTTSSTPTTDTLAFPSPLSSYQVQSSVNFNLNVNPATSVILTAADSKLRFGYNSECYGGASQSIITHKMEFWSNSLSFITFASDPGTTSQTFSFTGLKNPVSIAPFTSSFTIDIIKKKALVSKLSYTTSLPTFTQGSFSAFTVTPESYLARETTPYKVQFSLLKDIPTNGNLKFTFPTDYTLQPNTCALVGVAFASCTISGLEVSFTGLSAVSTTTAITLYVSAQNPSASGPTGVFTLTSTDAGNYEIATSTAPFITVLATSSFNFLQSLDILSKLKRAQALDIAPLKFTFALLANLAAGSTNYVDFIFPTSVLNICFLQHL